MGGGPKSSNGARPKLTVRGRLSDVDAESDTDELPRLTASGVIASSALASTTTVRPSGSAPPDQISRPRRGDHAAKRDRRAEKRERAAQAERARAERVEQAAQAERERAREAELAARAVQVLRDRERAAREQAEREAAERTERERVERERVAQAEREHAEREAAIRAERERAAQVERERAEREERDRTARERERAAQQRAAQSARERAEREQADREQAAQAEREQAERERVAQAEREQAERERATQAEWAAPAVAELDKAAQPDSVASPNGTVKPGAIVKPDDTGQPDAQRLAAAAGADVLVYPRRTARQQPVRRRRSRTIALIAAAAVVVAAGPIAIMLARHSTPPPDGSGSVLRNEAAFWISHQIDPNDVVSCDVTMCQTLEAYGVPTGYLLVLNAGQRDLLNSSVIVSTAAIRQLFGSRLDTVYAPVVLASFGSGKARIEVRVIAKRGPAAYMSQFNNDVQERKITGNQLVQQLSLSTTARRQLVTGQVDSRLLFLFTELPETENSLNVLAFGDSGPGASAGVPLRSVYLAVTGSAARSALEVVRSQRPPFRASRAGLTTFDGRPALYIEFAAPPPLGLLNGDGSGP
jgi:hypothetical protein